MKKNTIKLRLTRSQLMAVQGSLIWSRDTTHSCTLRNHFTKLLDLLDSSKEVDIRGSNFELRANDAHGLMSYIAEKQQIYN